MTVLVSDGLWLSGPSGFLEIVGLARHENTHSRMLGWLLDADGPARLGLWVRGALGKTLHRGTGVRPTGSEEGGVFRVAE